MGVRAVHPAARRRPSLVQLTCSCARDEQRPRPRRGPERIRRSCRMRVLVLGTTGYVGGASARALTARGHPVSGLACSAEAAERLEAARFDVTRSWPRRPGGHQPPGPPASAAAELGLRQGDRERGTKRKAGRGRRARVPTASPAARDRVGRILRPMRTLIVGASGYIGGRLVPLLQAQGRDLVLMSRDARPLAARFPGTKVVAADLLDPSTLPAALDGVRRRLLPRPLDGGRRAGVRRAGPPGGP